jgi:hypothetical protein
MKALALASLLLALALSGCGSEDAGDAVATQPETLTESVTETEAPAATETETETETEPEVACSTAALRLTLPDQDLPPEVADVRKRVFGAAVACDYDTLEQIALEKGEGFTFSYGGGESAAEFWRSVEEAGDERPLPMRALATILTMPFTRNESGSYAWPTAYDEAPTEEAWQDLTDAGLYGEDAIAAMKAGGSYLGYRTAITADGDWQFFVAGD